MKKKVPRKPGTYMDRKHALITATIRPSLFVGKLVHQVFFSLRPINTITYDYAQECLLPPLTFFPLKIIICWVFSFPRFRLHFILP